MPKNSEDPNVPALSFSAGRQSGEGPAWHFLDSTMAEERALLARTADLPYHIRICGTITYHVKTHGRGSL